VKFSIGFRSKVISRYDCIPRNIFNIMLEVMIFLFGKFSVLPMIARVVIKQHVSLKFYHKIVILVVNTLTVV